MDDDVFARVRHALEGQVSSSEISHTIRTIETTIENNRHWRSEHEAAIIDPLASSDAVALADRSIAATVLAEKRLTEAGRRLGVRLVEVRAVEVEADRRMKYDRAKKLRDKAAAEIRAEWVKHASGLVAVVERIAAVDAEIASAFDKPPAGEPPLDGVTGSIRRPGLMNNSTVSFTAHVSLPPVPEWGAPGFVGDYVRTRLG